MRRALTVWDPAGTPPMLKVPSAADTAPRRVPSTKTLTSPTGCCVTASITLPVMVPEGGTGFCAPRWVDMNKPTMSAMGKRRTTAIRRSSTGVVSGTLTARFCSIPGTRSSPMILSSRNRRGRLAPRIENTWPLNAVWSNFCQAESSDRTPGVTTGTETSPHRASTRPPRRGKLFRDGIRWLEAALFEERLHAWIATAEIAIERRCVHGAATRQDHRAEPVTIGAGETAVLTEPGERVVVQHFAPGVGVIACRIAAIPDVREVGAMVARWNFSHRDVEAVQRLLLECIDIRRNAAGRQGVPGEIE